MAGNPDATVPDSRTDESLDSEHISDHNNLHAQHNLWTGVRKTDYVKVDGSQPPTADMPLGSNKITGLADGTAATDAASKGQVDTALALKASTSHKDTHKTGGSDALTVSDLLDAIARVTVSKAGVDVGSRRTINFIEGTNVTFTITDDSGNEEIDITINAALTGGTVSNAGFIIVASDDAPTAVKNAADYTCDGVDDDVQINAALVDAAPLASRSGPVGAEQRGRVLLTGGQFVIESPILMYTGTTLWGSGNLTQLVNTNITSSAGAGTNIATIKLFDTNTHLVEVGHLWIDGNWASGGNNSHGIAFETGSGTHSAYPDTNPDADIKIHDLLITGHDNAGTRHGIFLDDDMRGSIIDRVQIRSCSGNGIYLLASPDSHISNVHIGTIDGSGIVLAGGNNKVMNCKAYYCDSWGLDVQSGRCTIGSFESQDNANGVRLSANHINASGIVIDTSNTEGIYIDGDHIHADAVVFLRASGRYASQTRGCYMQAGSTNCHAKISVDPSNITTERGGTWTGTANFIRISDGSTLYTVGA